MLDELKENTDGQLNEIRRMMHERNDSINKEIEPIKNEIKKNSEAKVYKNRTEKFTSRIQQQT